MAYDERKHMNVRHGWSLFKVGVDKSGWFGLALASAARMAG
jgi:hypothetical protein